MRRLPMLQITSITCRDARLAQARLGSLLETPA
jgi:hypothetical protein